MSTPMKRKSTPEKLIEGHKLPMMALGAIIAGLIAAVFAVSSTLKTRELARLDRQIDELYGPLDGRIRADSTYWKKFCSENCPNGKTFFGEGPSVPRDVQVWRSYILSTSLPNVRAMSDLIQTRSELVVGDSPPSVFGQLTDHRNGYELLVAKWATEPPTCAESFRECDALFASANVSSSPWPQALEACVRDQLQELRHVRAELASQIFVFGRPKILTAEACNALQKQE